MNQTVRPLTAAAIHPVQPNDMLKILMRDVHAGARSITRLANAIPTRRPRVQLVLGGILTLSLGIVHAQTPAQLELFEKNARPLFVDKCQGCHNAKLKSGGFDLTSPAAIKEAASMGIFGNPAEPEKSVIVKALSYEGQVKMPPQGKLPAETIAAVREWVAAGAPIPAVTPSAGDSLSGTGVRPVALRGVITDFDKNFWSFRPVSQAAPPTPKQKDWAINPIDQFILANLEKNGLKPAPPADKTTLLRRATFDLTGLPPTGKELQDFLADK
jgi:hypothetical protein